MNRNDAHLK